MTKIKYSYKEGKKIKKSTDTVELKVLELSDYDCKFIDLNVKTKESDRKEPYNSFVLIPIPNPETIDGLIAQLKEIKKSMKAPKKVRLKQCERCDIKDHTVQTQIDSYVKEMSNQEVECTLCSTCFTQRRRDI